MQRGGNSSSPAVRSLLPGLAALLLVSAGGSARADEEPSSVRFEPSVAWGQSDVGWVWEPEVPGLTSRCGAACAPQVGGGQTVRVGAAMRFGGLSLEATYGWVGDRGPSGGGRRALSVGVRLDSASEAVFSLYFRVAWLQRLGDLSGSGGLGGLGLQLRLLGGRATLFAEAQAEATSVGGPLRDAGAIFSWGTWTGFGLRLGFG